MLKSPRFWLFHVFERSFLAIQTRLFRLHPQDGMLTGEKIIHDPLHQRQHLLDGRQAEDRQAIH